MRKINTISCIRRKKKIWEKVNKEMISISLRGSDIYPRSGNQLFFANGSSRFKKSLTTDSDHWVADRCHMDTCKT